MEQGVTRIGTNYPELNNKHKDIEAIDFTKNWMIKQY